MSAAVDRRSAGLLLHPTSLPGRFGIGDLGAEAHRFVDWAADAGQSVWQMLPLGPPDEHNSPYSALSSFAGSPLLIAPEPLRQEGLLADEDFEALPSLTRKSVAYRWVRRFKDRLLRRSWERFDARASPALRDELEAFCNGEEQQAWLDDWALFAALLRRHDQRGWWDWDEALARREPKALAAARQAEAEEIAYQRYLQFLFARQWRELRRHARRRGVRLLGDLPIYVALNSAEVWAHRQLFELDEAGRPLAVAGVPPDYFSDTGQRWGNPLYRWGRLAEDGYRWWIDRIAANLRLVDALRIDHFRGFSAYWRVPAEEETAIHGQWVPGPGRELFDALEGALGRLPLLAEDLGVITPDVEALRDELGLPGMRVLLFGFGDDDSIHAPHRFVRNSAVYTGTHDNDTAAGWYRKLDSAGRRRLQEYCGARGKAVPWALIRLAYSSVADLAVVPVQDVLGLGNRARMNRPGRADGNWAWRLAPEALTPQLADRLRRLAELTGRCPTDAPAKPEGAYADAAASGLSA